MVVTTEDGMRPRLKNRLSSDHQQEIINSGATSSPVDDVSAKADLKEFVAGAISGFGKTLVGYPFDTIKSRMQTGKYPSNWHALTSTVRNEGVMALYQGALLPTLNVCTVGGILFFVNDYIRQRLQPQYPQVALTYGEMFAAGAGAGLVVGLSIVQVEVIKVNLQVANRRTPGGGDASVRGVLRRIGWRNLWAGFNPTLLREAGTFGIFFPTNEYLKDLLTDGKPETISLGARMAAAGTGGMICWVPCYPIDVIKTRMQLKGTFGYATMGHCGAEIYREHGLRNGFFMGMTPVLVRAFPAYAAQFIAYEYCREWLG